jgi:small subunit ribosomal protein S13
MARIAGVDLPRGKRVVVAFTYIHGIGPSTSKKLCSACGFEESMRTEALTELDIRNVRNYIEENLKVEGDLRREVQLNIKRLMDLGCYRGLRHRRGLPVRGQRTRTNARTRKGPRRVVTKKKK